MRKAPYIFHLKEEVLRRILINPKALNKGRLGEAEEHFSSLIRVTERVNSGNHWALEEAEIILESSYFLRRLKVLEMHLQC